MILLTQPPRVPGLQVCPTTPGYIYLFNLKWQFLKWHFTTIPLRGSIKIIFLPVNSTQNKTFVGLPLRDSFGLAFWKLILILPIKTYPMLDMSSKVNWHHNDKFITFFFTPTPQSWGRKFSKFILSPFNHVRNPIPVIFLPANWRHHNAQERASHLTQHWRNSDRKAGVLLQEPNPPNRST